MPKITRSRESHSCRTCRRRRVRCDKVHPACSRCAASGLTCIYSDRGAPTPGSPTETESKAIVARPPLRAPAEQGHLEVGQNGFSFHASSTFWGNSSKQLGGDLRALLFSVSSTRTPFAGAFEGVGPSDPKLGGFSKRTPVFSNNDDFTQECPLCGGRLSLNCLLAMLPEKDICDHLCNLFAVAVYPLMPILHQPDFLAQYQAFWAENVERNWHISGPGQVVRKDPTFVPLLFSMLFAATIIESSGASSEEAEDVFSGDLYFATMASLNLTGFPRRATHNSLAAYLFAQLQLSREEEFLDSPTFVSTSFRTALGMGLHRDGSAFGCSPIQIENRRKLWWHVIHLDTMVASSSGLPPLFINENISNTGMVSVYEDLLSDSDLLSQPDQEAKVDVRHLVAKCRYNLTKAIRGIICKHLECRLDTLHDVEEALTDLDELRKSVWATITTISADAGAVSSDTSLTTKQPFAHSVLPSMSQPWSLDSTSPTVQTFRLYAATMLHLMLHKAYIMLLSPAMKTPDKSIWGSVRQTAIRHSHAYIRLFALLCTSPFAHFSWMYPGTYQPLQSLSLILADLIETPESAEAETSIGLVDAMFALYQVGEGVINPGCSIPPSGLSGAASSSSSSSTRRPAPGTAPRRRNLSRAGQEAWSFLVNARRKALVQQGMDPHVLLPVSVDWVAWRMHEDGCVCGGSREGARQSRLQEVVLALPAPMGRRTAQVQQQRELKLRQQRELKLRQQLLQQGFVMQIQEEEEEDDGGEQALGFVAGDGQGQSHVHSTIEDRSQQDQHHQHHHQQQQQHQHQQHPFISNIFPPATPQPPLFPDLTNAIPTSQSMMSSLNPATTAIVGTPTNTVAGAAAMAGPSANTMTTGSAHWSDETLSTEAMAFDWDQWDAVLGGAFGSLV